MVLKLDNKEKADILTAFELIKACEDIEMKPETKKRIDSLYKKVKKSMQKIKPRSAKNRGLNQQKMVCQYISDLTGIPYDQSSDDCLIHSRESGLNGTDVILRGEAKKEFPYSVEVKDCNTITLPAWIAQAKENSDEDFPWLLFIHSQILDDKDIVVMKKDTFGELFLRGK